MPFNGTTRSDFVYRVYKIKEKEIDPEALKLINDLWEAFERGFKFAIKLKEYKQFEEMGEILRLHLMNEQEEIEELNKRIKSRVKTLPANSDDRPDQGSNKK